MMRHSTLFSKKTISSGIFVSVLLVFISANLNFLFQIATPQAASDYNMGVLLLDPAEKVNKKRRKVSKAARKCWRPCPQRINRIYYQHGAAGLGDRIYIILQLAEIAGYLCARLELPPPSILLSSHHNNGLLVNDALTWQDLKNLTFRDQSSSSFDQDFKKDIKNWRKVPVYDPKRYSDWMHVISTDTEGIIEDYEMLQEFSWKQPENGTTGFLWEIHMSYYKSSLFQQDLPNPSQDIQNNPKYLKRMRPQHHFLDAKKNNKKCSYINMEASKPNHVKELQQQIIERIRERSLQNSIYGFFHIRRNDAMRECDSSLPVIRKYLQCSLNGTEKLGKNMTILLGSDEIDQSYRNQVFDLAKDYSHVKLLDADQITEQILKNAISNGFLDEGFENNFYIYELESALRQYTGNFSSFFLDKRRGDCEDCIPLFQTLKKRLGDIVAE
jgi:hypothetical protein